MRLAIAAIGRLKTGPEQDLIQDYTARINASGRSLALGPLDIFEIDERKARDRASQSGRLLDQVPKGAVVAALDERGAAMTSPKFANLIERTRDDGADDNFALLDAASGTSRIAWRATNVVATHTRALHMLCCCRRARVCLYVCVYVCVCVCPASASCRRQ